MKTKGAPKRALTPRGCGSRFSLGWALSLVMSHAIALLSHNS